MKISVVVPAYNAAETFAEQLDALASQPSPVPFEIVVADNGSTDDTVAIARSYESRFERLDVVDASDVRGVAHARNVGALAATGTDVVICDADDVVGDGWLAAMARALEKHPFVAARLEHRRLNPEWTVRIRGEPQSHRLAGGDFFRPFAWGGSIGIRRDLHIAVGGFDESFPTTAGEDNDYSWRLHALGVQPILVEDAVIHIRHRVALGDVFRQSQSYGCASAVLLNRWKAMGMRAPGPPESARDWASLFFRLPLSLRSHQGRAAWVSSLGWRLGRRRGRKFA